MVRLYLYFWYIVYNHLYFHNKLKIIPIKYKIIVLERNIGGMFTFIRNNDEIIPIKITISPRVMFKDLKLALLHEMLHYYLGITSKNKCLQGHDKNFIRFAKVLNIPLILK